MKRSIFILVITISIISTALAQPSGLPRGGFGFFIEPVSNSIPNSRYGDQEHPDFSGVWASDGFPMFFDYASTPLPLTPSYAEKLRRTRELFSQGNQIADSVNMCLAFGMPRFMSMMFESIQTPGQLTLILDALSDVRRIYTDGSGHTPNAELSYNGNSAGIWDGDTLIIETRDIRANIIDVFGVPYSDKLTVVESWRLVAQDKLAIEFTLKDPEAFTRPWMFTRTYTRLQSGTRLEEYVCENNRFEGPTLP